MISPAAMRLALFQGSTAAGIAALSGSADPAGAPPPVDAEASGASDAPAASAPGGQASVDLQAATASLRDPAAVEKIDVPPSEPFTPARDAGGGPSLAGLRPPAADRPTFVTEALPFLAAMPGWGAEAAPSSARSPTDPAVPPRETMASGGAAGAATPLSARSAEQPRAPAPAGATPSAVPSGPGSVTSPSTERGAGAPRGPEAPDPRPSAGADAVAPAARPFGVAPDAASTAPPSAGRTAPLPDEAPADGGPDATFGSAQPRPAGAAAEPRSGTASGDAARGSARTPTAWSGGAGADRPTTDVDTDAASRRTMPVGVPEAPAADRNAAGEPPPAGSNPWDGRPRPAPPGTETRAAAAGGGVRAPLDAPHAARAPSAADRGGSHRAERRQATTAPRPSADRDEPAAAARAAQGPEAPSLSEAPVHLFPRGPAVDDGPKQGSGRQPEAAQDGAPSGAACRTVSGAGAGLPVEAARHGGDAVPGREGLAPASRNSAASPADGRPDGSALAGALAAIAGQDWSGAAGTIIPCAVFNAAMIPGWPPPRPFDVPELGAAAARALPVPRDEEAVLARFAERGGPRHGNLLKRASARRKRRMLAALAAVMDTIETVLTAIEAELLIASRNRAAEGDDLAAADLRRQLTA